MSFSLFLLLQSVAVAQVDSLAEVVAEALSGLPADARLSSLHWDGRRLWMSGDGTVPISTDGRSLSDGWPRLAGSGLDSVMVAGGSLSDTVVRRRPLFVQAHAVSGVAPADRPTGGSWLQSRHIWMAPPQYTGEGVVLVGRARRERDLEGLEHLLHLSPCLSQPAVERLPRARGDSERSVPFAVRARVFGALDDAACRPAVVPESVELVEHLELRGDWGTIWDAIRQPWPAPVASFTVAPDRDELVLSMSFFVDDRMEAASDGKVRPRPLLRADHRALGRPAGLPADGLRLAGLKVASPVLPGPLPPLGLDGLVGAEDAPSSPEALVDRYGLRLHGVLSALDTSLCDLRSARVVRVRAVHAQVVEVDVQVELQGQPAELQRLYETLPKMGAKAASAPDGAGWRTTLTVSVPVMASGPRVRFAGGAPDGLAEPPSPFRPTAGWSAFVGAEASGELLFEPLVPYKVWHLAYLGLFGGTEPVGFVQAPDGQVMRVRPGARVGDRGALASGMDHKGLTLQSPDRTDAPVVLPAAAHPPDEAPLPATHVGKVHADALQKLRLRFPEGLPIDLDMAGADLGVLIDLVSQQGVPVVLADGLGPLPRVSVRSHGRPVGHLLADMQLVLLPYGLVFDETLVLLHDPQRAAVLAASLFGREKVALHTLLELHDRPVAEPLHLSGVDTFDLLRLYGVDSVSVQSSMPPLYVSAASLNAVDAVAAMEGHLSGFGEGFWWTGERLVVVGPPPSP